MSDLKDKLAVYNNPIDFKIKFIASKLKDIYKTFIIEEKLNKALTFNLKNSFIKADDELIVGNFKYDDTDKLLRIEIDNPSVDKDTIIEVVIGTNITDLPYIIESNYIITNEAYIKIKGYENIKGLITKSNLITKKFNGIKLDIFSEPVNNVVPAINEEKIILKYSFNTLDTDIDYKITVKDNMGNNLKFDSENSFMYANGVAVDFVRFEEINNIASVNINNCSIIRNKKIDIVITAEIKNAEEIPDVLINECCLSINDIECSSDTINIQLIKPILSLNNSIIEE